MSLKGEDVVLETQSSQLEAGTPTCLCLLSALQEEYNADPLTLRQDVAEFLQTLRNYKVLE